MKVFFFAALLAVLNGLTSGQNTQKLSAELKKKVDETIKECQRKHSLDTVTINVIRNGMWHFIQYDDPDDNARCFLKCYLKKEALKNDRIDEQYLEKIAKVVGSDNMKNAKKNCKDKMQVKTCEEAYKTFKCFHENKATVL